MSRDPLQSARSRPERTGWRDERLSRRRRLWGYDVPSVDLDFVLVEYDNFQPVALIEWKNCDGFDRDVARELRSASARVLKNLGDRARLPTFFCLYRTAPWRFRVVYANEAGRRSLGVEWETEFVDFGEAGFVRFLYALRSRPCPDAVLWNIDAGVSITEARR